MKSLKLASIVMIGSMIGGTLNKNYSAGFASEGEEEISKIIWQIEKFDFNKEYEFSLVSTLMRYWNEKGKYPASLDELKLYEPMVRIDDPFNVFYMDNEVKRRQFIYKREDIIKCSIRSIGPDRRDDNGSKEYNRENGWKSKGDISVHIIRNEIVPREKEKKDNN